MSRFLLLSVSMLWCAALSRGYTGSDDRFVKKYAMMKVYESCFGSEVVREVRQEMRAASAKCQDRSPGPSPAGPGLHSGLSFGLGPAGFGHGHGHGVDRLDRPLPPPVRSHRPQLQQHHHLQQQQQSADSSRLQQALMAVLNRQAQGGGFSAYRPVSQSLAAAAASAAPAAPSSAAQHVSAATAPAYSSAPGGYSAAPSGLSELLSQYQAAASSAAPAAAAAAPAAAPAQQTTGTGIYQAMPHVDPLQALQALQALQQYQSRGGGGSGGSGSGSHYHFQQQQQQQQQPSYYQHSFGSRYSKDLKQGPRGSGRASRDLDVQGQLETLTTRMTGRVKNVTCVMQELGYLDSALEPDFDRIAARISRLPVAAELRRDMLDGVQFCRQFSQCIPDSRRDKFLLSGELLRPMFFFRCYKHKKLEACIVKDVRERYQQAAVDDNLPNTRSMDFDRGAADNLDEDHMAAAVYEFLYGGDNLDADTFF